MRRRWTEYTAQLVAMLCKGSSCEVKLFNAPLGGAAANGFRSFHVSTDAGEDEDDRRPFRTAAYEDSQVLDLVSMPADGYIRATQARSQLAFAPTQGSYSQGYAGTQAQLSQTLQQFSQAGSQVPIEGFAARLQRRKLVSRVRSQLAKLESPVRPAAPTTQRSQLYLIEDADAADSLTSMKVKVLPEHLLRTKPKRFAAKKRRKVTFALPGGDGRGGRKKKKEKKKRVVLYRKYRKGELPDIEISLGEIVDPLIGLCGLDGNTASMLLTSLFKAFFTGLKAQEPLSLLSFCERFGAWLPGETSLDAFVALVSSGVDALSPHTRKEPGVAMRCLHSLADAASQCDFEMGCRGIDCRVPVKSIQASCERTPSNLFSSILLCENYLLRDKMELKRNKSVTQQFGDDSQWFSLVHMYEAVEEHDIAMGLLRFAGHDAEKASRALEKEFDEGDFTGAAALYLSLYESASDDSDERKQWSRGEIRCRMRSGDFENAVKFLGERATTADDFAEYAQTALSVPASIPGLDETFEALRATNTLQVLRMEHPVTAASVLDDDSQTKYAALCDFLKIQFPLEWKSVPAHAAKLRARLLFRLQLASEIHDAFECSMNGSDARRALKGRWSLSLPDEQLDAIQDWGYLLNQRERLLGGAMLTQLREKFIVAATKQREFDVALACAKRLYKKDASVASSDIRKTVAPTSGSLEVVNLFRSWARSESHTNASNAAKRLKQAVSIHDRDLSKRMQYCTSSAVRAKFFHIYGGVYADASEYFSGSEKYAQKAHEYYSKAVETFRECSLEERKRTGGTLFREYAIFCGERDSTMPAFVSNILRAIEMGDGHACDMFPRVLTALRTRECRSEFAARVHPGTFPISKLLGWSDQLMSSLGEKEISGTIRPLLEAMALEHPFELVYTFKLSKCAYESRKKQFFCGRRLERILRNELVDTFLREMGKLKKTINNDFDLSDVSPWLAEYCGGAEYSRSTEEEDLDAFSRVTCLKIPGRRDVYIRSFETHVKVLCSKEMPKRIFIWGSDERRYSYLVKGGDDLRADRRIEQTFDMVNSMLRRDPDCRKRGMRMETFSVVPFTLDFGMIEWVEGTRMLKDVLREEVLKSPESDFVVSKRSRSSSSRSRSSGDSAKRVGFEFPSAKAFVQKLHKNTYAWDDAQVRSAFEDIVRLNPVDLLRNHILRSSSSPEHFIELRSNYLFSVATLSAAGYMLGVGDRHLGNLLFREKDCRIVAIDFGYSFGIGPELPIPETTPFRMTPVMLDALLPLNGMALMERSIAMQLKVVRRSERVLSSMLETFVREPLQVWKRFGPDEAFYRVQFCRQKLKGAAPAIVIANEIMMFRKEKGKKENGKDVYYGDRRLLIRPALRVTGFEAYIPEDRGTFELDDFILPVQEQARQLMQMATDRAILGRQYWGWYPSL